MSRSTWWKSCAGWNMASGCATTTAPLVPDAIEGVSSALEPEAPEFIPVVRYGRYTLVSTEPTTEQRDLLAQIIEVSILSSLNPSVQEAMQYVLQRSGYALCPVTPSVRVLFTRPLPAAHYRLGPISLRRALQVLAGPAWQLTTDEVSRSVCFAQQKTDADVVPLTPVSPHQSEARP